MKTKPMGPNPAVPLAQYAYYRDKFSSSEVASDELCTEVSRFRKAFAEIRDVCSEPWSMVLDVGSGPNSTAGSYFSSDDRVFVVAIDTLLYAYQTITPKAIGSNYLSIAMDGENMQFLDSTFNAVVCTNVVDQTPNPNALFREMVRVLRPGGYLFFEVHCNQELTPRQYILWDAQMVHEHVAQHPLQLVREWQDWDEALQLYRFYGLYTKRNIAEEKKRRYNSGAAPSSASGR
jgi:ubiquinone/menaquinone biosynthesis C-methylase UbiE